MVIKYSLLRKFFVRKFVSISCLIHLIVIIHQWFYRQRVRNVLGLRHLLKDGIIGDRRIEKRCDCWKRRYDKLNGSCSFVPPSPSPKQNKITLPASTTFIRKIEANTRKLIIAVMFLFIFTAIVNNHANVSYRHSASSPSLSYLESYFSFSSPLGEVELNRQTDNKWIKGQE